MEDSKGFESVVRDVEHDVDAQIEDLRVWLSAKSRSKLKSALRLAEQEFDTLVTRGKRLVDREIQEFLECEEMENHRELLRAKRKLVEQVRSELKNHIPKSAAYRNFFAEGLKDALKTLGTPVLLVCRKEDGALIPKQFGADVKLKRYDDGLSGGFIAEDAQESMRINLTIAEILRRSEKKIIQRVLETTSSSVAIKTRVERDRMGE